jgi:hypothetical protein
MQYGRLRSILLVLCFAFSLGLYVYTLAPTVTFVDSGELATAVTTRGVSHPSGSPLYLLLASLAAAIPIGTTIVRLNAFSALCAALSVALLFLGFAQARSSLRRMIQQIASKKGKKRASVEVVTTHELPAGMVLAGAGAAALAWGTNLGLWSTATVTEVYALHALLLTLLALLLFHYSRATAAGKTEEGQRWLALAAVTTGLGLANYPPFGIVAPAIFGLLMLTEGKPLWNRWGRNTIMVLFFLLGLLPYVLLPLRASADPLLNWGNPSNWKNFLGHISAQQYQIFLSKPNPAVLSEVFPLWFRQWSAPVWVLVPFGFAGMALSRRKEFLYTLLLAAANLFYVLSYDVTDVSSAPSDFAIYLLPLFWCTALWAGAGVCVILRLLKSRMPRAFPAAYAIAFLPLLSLATNYHQAGHRGYTYADDFVRSVLEPAAPNALILTSDWTFVSPALYLHHVEHVRPDITFFDVELLRRSWYFSYVRKRAPWLAEKTGKSINEFLHELAKYENNQPYDPEVITNKYVTMLNGFIASGLETNHPPYILLNLQSKEENPQRYRQLETALGRPPYMTVGVAPGAIGAGYQWVPEASAFRLYGDTVPHALPEIPVPLKPFAVDGDYDQITRGIVARYAEFWRWRGDYLRNAQNCAEANRAYHKALDLSPDLPEALAGLAECP